MIPVLGLDPSLTSTGLVKVSAGGVIETGRIETAAAPGLAGTRNRIRHIVGRALRFAPSECLTVIEAPYIPPHNSGSVLERAWLFGFLVDQLMRRGPVVQVAPATRAVYATGNGRAGKALVLATMRERFPGLTIVDDNVADALALACMGARHLGSPVDGPAAEKQARAMAVVRWQSMKEES